jgi:hypothetical protein
MDTRTNEPVKGEEIMLDRISESINRVKPRKGLSPRAYMAIIKKIVRANRSKYTPHVGKKQEAKKLRGEISKEQNNETTN